MTHALETRGDRSTESPERLLVVTADDFGIGPATSHGILDLASRGVVTSTVLLVNSPFAAEGVAAWRAAGCPMELGWHPCLTLDQPILPPERVPSLVGVEGRFLGLGRFLQRLILGRVRESEVEAELLAQWRRFVDLVGIPPTNVNAHHHLHVFGPVGRSLARILARQTPAPFVRRVVEPLSTLKQVPGARLKRAVLGYCGRRAARRQQAAFAGNDSLIGITDPPLLGSPDFFTRWLAAARGRVVELSCHPGHFDPTLIGRDGTLADGHIHRRPHELGLLCQAGFLSAAHARGFTLVTAAEATRHTGTGALGNRIAG
jgi:predicted glycoside hydrolase/deacetylase ChbG (UPF0249 family)